LAIPAACQASTSPPALLALKPMVLIALAGCVTVYGFGDGKDAGRGVMPVS
jgi:hypothetical protein